MGALGGLAACSRKSNSDKALKNNGDASNGVSSKVPDDFPDDVPLPEGGDLTGSYSTDSGFTAGRTAKSFSLTYSYGNAADVSDAADAYKTQIKDDGFDIISEFSGSSQGGHLTEYSASNDKYHVTVYAGGGTGGGGDDTTLLVNVTLASGN